ncbi:MAG: acyltransferase domain-containing protein, partial [bacterium]|nr:acyltransferase domain-containing protein [bacterium]
LLGSKDLLSTRISYKLNLEGPSTTVQTTCSTSLVAIHLACRSLLSGECNMALAGGVSIMEPQKIGYLYQEGMLFSRDGHVRAFDEKSDGMVFGSGSAVVLLKTLEEAEEDRDNIYAVVKGTAINNDGGRKVGFTAPSVEGQAEVISAAHMVAEVEPESIGYVEAHGTGTELGDSIEIKGLTRAFASSRKRYCRLGAVKTNVGHLDAAAGATGFIKTVLVLKNRQIPPTLHFQKPNPELNLENTPFYVNKELEEMTRQGDTPLRAGVSSFGIGGTNAHAVLEEYTGHDNREPGQGREYKILCLSAGTETALNAVAATLDGNLRNDPGIEIADAAYTLQVGRRRLPYRQIAVCSQREEALQQLTETGTGKQLRHHSNQEDPPVIFMFSGLGGQYENMGLELYRSEAVFRREMDRCFEIIKNLTGSDIKETLYPDRKAGEPGEQSAGEGNTKNVNTAGTGSTWSAPGMSNIVFHQCVVFVFEYALANQLLKWGIEPEAMIGYSFGEYTAACISGVFSLEDTIRLIVMRGELLETTAGGAMLNVPLTARELAPLLEAPAALAVDNGDSCLVSGPVGNIDEFEKQMKQKGKLCMRLATNYAIQSPTMETIAGEFETRFAGMATGASAPEIPYISNVTGRWTTPEEVADPAYWTTHLKKTVRFSDGIKELVKKENAIFIEIGPGRELCTMVRRYIENKPGQKVLHPVNHPGKRVSEHFYLLYNTAKLWLYGVSVDWTAFYEEEERKRISLPTYPFQRENCRLDSSALDMTAGILPYSTHRGQESQIRDWFYTPSWTRTPLPPQPTGERISPSQWVVFTDSTGLGEQLAAKLSAAGERVIEVVAGEEYGREKENRFTIEPGKQEHYEALFKQLADEGKKPEKILHLPGLTPPGNSAAASSRDERAQETGSLAENGEKAFFSLIYLARALEGKGTGTGIRIYAITGGIEDVTGEEKLIPEKSLVNGPLKVIPQEYPGITCKRIDIVQPR